jgi:hypothetical protein
LIGAPYDCCKYKNVKSVKSSKREGKCTLLTYLKKASLLCPLARAASHVVLHTIPSCKTNNHTETHKNNPKPTVQTGCTLVATVDGFVVLALVLGRAHFSHSAVQQVSVSAAEKMVRDDM